MLHVSRQLTRTIGLESHAPFWVNSGQRSGKLLSQGGAGGHRLHIARQFWSPNLSNGKVGEGVHQGEGGFSKTFVDLYDMMDARACSRGRRRRKGGMRFRGRYEKTRYVRPGPPNGLC